LRVSKLRAVYLLSLFGDRGCRTSSFGFQVRLKDQAGAGAAGALKIRSEKS